MKDFGGKLVFITGGSAGIGLAAARLFAGLGAKVVIFARNRERLDKAVSEINAAGVPSGGSGAGFCLDVGDNRAVLNVMARAMSDAGTPDLLVNCAGRAIPRPFTEVSFDQFSDTMRVNLFGVWSATAAVVPAMMKRGSGHVVNVSSVAGLIGVYGYTDYAASKFAVVGFSEALRCELAPHGIGVSVLCPPDTDTPGLALENRTKPPETCAISAKAKVVSAEKVAEALLCGIRKGRFLILPGADAKSAALIKRLAPGLVFSVMDRAVCGVRGKKP
ncbi:MAG: SDR family oxidoreductase [Deltaproteobacteria bacterium]|nr:SDR family oxidoreductase [Deltaproteobacteria bacterium]